MAFPSGYTGYDTVTPDDPTGSLTDFFYVINANLLSATWWANVKSDGGDVQVYKTDGTRLPVYLHNWNYGTNTGNIYFGYTGTKAASSESVRVYAGNASESQPAAAASFGQYAVFPSSLKAFYPTGGGNDVTTNANNLTMNGSPTVGGVAGPISGSLATDYNGTSQRGSVTISSLASTPVTILGSMNSDNLPFRTLGCFSAGDNLDNQDLRTEPSNAVIYSETTGGWVTAQKSGVTTSAWFNLAGVVSSDSSRQAFVNGVGGTVGTGTRVVSPLTRIKVGVRGNNAQQFDGKLVFMGYYAVALSANHIAYWHSMLADPDQSDFYTMGGWTANSSSRLLLTNAAYFGGRL